MELTQWKRFRNKRVKELRAKDMKVKYNWSRTAFVNDSIQSRLGLDTALINAILDKTNRFIKR